MASGQKSMMNRVGELTFDIPQVRGGGFYPSALEKVSRTEQALMLDPQGDHRPGSAARVGGLDFVDAGQSCGRTTGRRVGRVA